MLNSYVRRREAGNRADGIGRVAGISGSGPEDGVKHIDPKTSYGAGRQSGMDRQPDSDGVATIKSGRRGLRRGHKGIGGR